MEAFSSLWAVCRLLVIILACYHVPCCHARSPVENSVSVLYRCTCALLKWATGGNGCVFPISCPVGVSFRSVVQWVCPPDQLSSGCVLQISCPVGVSSRSVVQWVCPPDQLSSGCVLQISCQVGVSSRSVVKWVCPSDGLNSILKVKWIYN